MSQWGKIIISEAYRLNEPVKEFDKEFQFFGIMQYFEKAWIGSASKPKMSLRFYATKDGHCYGFEDGHDMPNATELFTAHLQANLKAQNEDKYLKLIEGAQKI